MQESLGRRLYPARIPLCVQMIQILRCFVAPESAAKNSYNLQFIYCFSECTTRAIIVWALLLTLYILFASWIKTTRLLAVATLSMGCCLQWI